MNELKIKEKNCNITLFPVTEKEITYKHADVIWSDCMFIRFLTEDKQYKCFSGAYLIEKNQ